MPIFLILLKLFILPIFVGMGATRPTNIIKEKIEIQHIHEQLALRR